MPPLTREDMREAGSLAFRELKKYPLYSVKTEDFLTTISLFGKTYQFFIDKNRKIMWMNSEHHYQRSKTFKLLTKHKEWEGIFSFPRTVAHQHLGKHLSYALKTAEKVREDTKSNAEKIGTECRIIVQQAYHADKKKMSRILGGVLWKSYDPEIAHLAMKLYGLGASSLDYTVIWNNKEEILDTLQKAPSILPIWRNIILVEMYKKRNKGEPFVKPYQVEAEDFLSLLDISKQIKSSYIDEYINEDYPGGVVSSFNYPEEVKSFVFPNIIKTVKDKLDSLGLTTAAWKFLLSLPIRSVQTLLKDHGLTGFASIINKMAKIGVIPRPSLVRAIGRLVDHNRDEFYRPAIRAGLLAALKMRRGVRSFYEREMDLVIDWIRHGGPGGGAVTLDENQKKAKWSWFMRQQEVWHRERAAREAIRTAQEAAELKEKVKSETWFSAIGEFEYKEYKIVPLTCTYDLIDEGKDMHHCVGNYARECLDDRSRIFSIRRNDAKIATLELKNETMYRVNYGNNDGKVKWVIGQCRGIKNSIVEDAVKKVSEEVAKRYNKAVNTVQAIAV